MNSNYRTYLAEGEQAGRRFRLAVPRQVPLGATGMQLGKGAGSSVDFRDFREYQPGDDLRRIDWSGYARSDKLHVRLYHDEVTPHLDVLLDGSSSMALADTAKPRAALGLAAVFAAAADNDRFSHSIYLAREGCEPVANGASAPSTWRGIEFDHSGSISDAMARLAPRWKPQSIRVLISDLLWMGEPQQVLRPMAHQAASLIVIQILAREDADPPLRGSIRLVDSETQAVHEIFVDATAARRYRNAMLRHQENWSRSARQMGATFTTLIAEDLVRRWDLTELVTAHMLKVG